ncbi:hypothetical protein AGOR_G00044380 [Albula goreensis]|uniref:Transmembrane protein 268 n=1 Tax=Albula goreensis TaxID=1534307 RepID=A0A8T3DZD5_9TELE|nr:hypothetical protein AGOR_G00044380 [Albula goreensis]
MEGRASALERASEDGDITHDEARPRPLRTQSDGSGTVRRTNGQCVFVVPSSSVLCPSFDLSVCRALLDREGFQIPIQDFEIPLQTALDSAPVRRYLFFNSAIFHFFMAPLVYIVVWCGAFSTLHMFYMASVWILCLSVSLVAVVITSAIVLILHHRNKQINVNVDVRLIQVNERLHRHNLLLGVANWVHHCSGTLQLFCVYWDLANCEGQLTDTLEGMSFARDEVQSKLRKNMSHLSLVTEVATLDPEAGEEEDETEEERPLLPDSQRGGRSTSTSQREETKLTKDYSLVPGRYLSAQATAQQLLLTYSATYVRLLVSDSLPRSSQRPLHPGRSHCSAAPLCLCQYVQRTVLR